MQQVITLLWSINDRAGGGDGADFPAPDLGWLNDVILANRYIVAQMTAKGRKEQQQVDALLKQLRPESGGRAPKERRSR